MFERMTKPAIYVKSLLEVEQNLVNTFGFFSRMFPEKEPHDIFLAWLQRAYQAAYHNKPAPGQVVFLFGETAVGKSFLAQRIVGRLLGGAADASYFMTKLEVFNGHLLSSPLWVVDDICLGSPKLQQTRYLNQLKLVTSQSTFTRRAKYEKNTKIDWQGRIIFIGNLDDVSRRVIPKLTMSLAEKVNLFVCERAFVEAGAKSQVESDKIIAELPHFATWLLLSDPPDGVQGDLRFGIKCWHDPRLIK